jgi:ribosomal protein S18 acetylase RimI-like enzyme
MLQSSLRRLGDYSYHLRIHHPKDGIIGWCNGCIDPIQKVGVINSLEINSSYRRGGLGSELLKTTEELLYENHKNLKLMRLTAYTYPPNDPVTRFFESNGYKTDVSVSPISYDDGEHMLELIQMTKIVSSETVFSATDQIEIDHMSWKRPTLDSLETKINQIQ